MYTCKHLTGPLEESWNFLVKENTTGGFQQSFFWTNFKRSQGVKTYKIGLFDLSGNLKAGVILHRPFYSGNLSFLYAPAGPILDYNNEQNASEQWELLKQAIFSIAKKNDEHRISHCHFEPKIQSWPSIISRDLIKSPFNIQPKSTRILNLSSSAETLLSEMKQKCRYNIRLAEKKEVRIQSIDQSTASDIEKFFNLYKSTSERQEFKIKDTQYFRDYFKTCGPNSKMFFATLDDEILSTAIMIYFGGQATYLYGASSGNKTNLMSNYLLQWQMILDAKKLGFSSYDMFGITPLKSSKNHPWTGITEFKNKFGGTRQDFVGAHHLVLNDSIYEKVIRKAQFSQQG
jgi:peptidoglycan pentaglycine glycine transferase (the first glycine)